MKFRINVVCLIEHNGKLLLGRKAPGVGPYIGSWLLPGGGVDLENETIDEAMKRETKEETNLSVTKFERLSFLEDITERHGQVARLIFLYYKITDTKDWKALKAGDDLVELKWFLFKELSKIPVPPISTKLFKMLKYFP